MSAKKICSRNFFLLVCLRLGEESIFKPITASSSSKNIASLPLLRKLFCLYSLLDTNTHRTKGTAPQLTGLCSVGWQHKQNVCKRPSRHTASYTLYSVSCLCLSRLENKSCAQKPKFIRHTAITQMQPLLKQVMLRLSSSLECSSIKSKANPFQKPTPSCITWSLRKASLKTDCQCTA